MRLGSEALDALTLSFRGLHKHKLRLRAQTVDHQVIHGTTVHL